MADAPVPRKKLFLILWLGGLLGVMSFLLVDLNALLTRLTLPAGTTVPPVTPLLRFLSVLQPTVLLSIAILVGVMLAPKVRLASPVAEAAASRQPLGPALRPQIVPGIWGGLAGGLAIVLTAVVTTSLLPPELNKRLAGLGDLLPITTRLLYGGIAEELLLRWGFMTLVTWVAWRLFQKGQGQPKPACFVGAILISSVVFAMGHLPFALALVPQAPFAFLAYVIVANSAFGLMAGYLYWKKGLESAMIAHMLAHVVLFTAHSLGSYF